MIEQDIIYNVCKPLLGWVRKMESNFEFLKKDVDSAEFFERAHTAEELYAEGHFSEELITIRTIAENVVKEIMDQKYLVVNDRDTFNDNLKRLRDGRYIREDIIEYLYAIKKSGNVSAHSIASAGKAEGLDNLKRIFLVLTYYYNDVLEIRPKADFMHFIEPIATNYNTAERKLIYIQTEDQSQKPDKNFEGLEKIGDASVVEMEADLSPNSDTLNDAAAKRIDQYMKTANLPYVLQWTELAYRAKDRTWFRDYDVHAILDRSGIKREIHEKEGVEWYEIDLETAKKAIKAYKEGKTSLDQEDLQVKEQETPKQKITLRPEQREAVNKTKVAFKGKDKKMLWNAKMRFGKTITALQLIKEAKYNKVLIMTHRPVVDGGWFKDFNKLGMNEAGYVYGSRKNGHRSVAELEKLGNPYVYFASIQDLRGSTAVGGKVADKNQDVFSVAWDLVIIDEAHEGTKTDLAQNVIDAVLKNNKQTRLLELSGTPFNLLSDYDEDHVFTWDYTMEQQAKEDFELKYPEKHNPYEGLPKVSMYTFEMGQHFTDPKFVSDNYGKYSFNFKEFFRTDENGKFVHEDYVKQFLDNITTPGATNYPFSNRSFRNNLRHTLWILPGIKECNALEELLKEHPVFKEEGYKIVNIVRGDTSDDEEASSGDVERVKNAMKPDPAVTKTITLTVRKMTTGVTIEPWTGVIFLSNTNSAMQYLQAAFRAQTPYSSETFGEKTNCYIFDFAPDRALTVMAESASLATGVGKIQKKEQRQNMANLLNFLPIIGEKGQSMKPYNVDSLLAKIKRAYAEKAVRSGFDDDSIYSDKLFLVGNADLNDFKDLRAIVGTTKEDVLKDIDVNNQGLTEEEYDKAQKSKKKKKNERSEEEQEAIDKLKELKKQRRTLISILRGVSIRIPMMIYGMDIDFDEDVSIRSFVNNVDDVSWEEFMPKGVTKDLFRKFIQYYDADVFIEAGKIIRRQVKELDKADPLERVKKIADIFGTFRNPDKETVLTPWRVVNMHMGKTIGGLVYYDDNYEGTTIDGRDATHWVVSENTDRVYKPDTHILEINSKTGLYPLFVTSSLYWQEFQKMNDQTAGKFSILDEQLIWKKILRENIFLVAKTPMAKQIAIRTLRGYNSDWTVNAEYVENIVDDAKADVNAEAEKIERLFGHMKFDVVIGNPPYQENTKNTSDNPIYHLFMNLGFKLSNLTTFITPARYLFDAGKTPHKWNRQMLNDEHFKIVFYRKNSWEVFPKTDIKGGVSIFVYDKTKKFKPIGTFTEYPLLNSILQKVEVISNEYMNSIGYSQNSFKFTNNLYEDHPELENVQSKGHKYDLKSNVFDKLSCIFSSEKKTASDIGIWGRLNNKRECKFTKRSYITNEYNVDLYKVAISKAYGRGEFGEKMSDPFIVEPGFGLTETFISFGKFKTKNEADDLLKYVRTKFFRTLLGVLKVTQDNTVAKYSKVPLQDFTPNSDIDWTKSIPEIDQQLYKKYGLSEDEINFIETKVQAMD